MRSDTCPGRKVKRKTAPYKFRRGPSMFLWWTVQDQITIHFSKNSRQLLNVLFSSIPVSIPVVAKILFKVVVRCSRCSQRRYHPPCFRHSLQGPLPCLTASEHISCALSAFGTNSSALPSGTMWAWGRGSGHIVPQHVLRSSWHALACHHQRIASLLQWA